MTWIDSAACKGKDQRHWFPVATGASYITGSRAGRPDDPYAYARSICAGCPVRAECLAEAVEAQRQGRSMHGMWGGLDEVERRKLPRQRKEPKHGTPGGYKQHGRLGEKACDACSEAKRASNGYTASKVAS